MDSPIFTVLIAVAGLVAGFVVCWLLMRGKTPAPAPQARPEAQAELTQARERVRQLEQERQAALKSYEDLKLQTAKARETPERTPKAAAPTAESAAQLAALQAQVATLQGQEKALRADAAKAMSDAQAEQAQAKEYFRAIEQKHQLAAAEHEQLKLQATKLRDALELARKEQAAPKATTAPDTRLPALEQQIISLQALEQSIKKEFQLLAELQRNVTLTSATIQEFKDSPESLANAPATA